MKKGFTGLLLLLVTFAFAGCNNVGPVVKYLKEINNEPARNWITFLQKNGIDAIDENGSTILVEAVLSEDPKFVEACLKSKANVNITSKYQKFPLSIAVANDNTVIADMLLKAGAQIIPRPAENNITFAITRHFDKTLDLLLQYKPDLDYRNSEEMLFKQTNMPPNAATIAKLDAAGFKPSRADLYTLTDSYRYAETPEDQATILSVIEKNAKDPVYREYVPNEEGNVLNLQYKLGLSEEDGYSSYKKALAIFKVFLDAGIPAKLDKPRSVASTDLGDVISATKDKPYFNEFKTLFESHGTPFVAE